MVLKAPKHPYVIYKCSLIYVLHISRISNNLLYKRVKRNSAEFKPLLFWFLHSHFTTFVNTDLTYVWMFKNWKDSNRRCFNFIPLHSVFRILDKCIAVFNEAQKRDRKEIVKTATILALSQQASSSCENMKQTRFFSTWLQKVKIKVKIS